MGVRTAGVPNSRNGAFPVSSPPAAAALPMVGFLAGLTAGRWG